MNPPPVKEEKLSKLNYVCLKSIDCKQGTVRAVRYNVDGSYCLTCGADRSVKLWNPKKSLLLKKYAGHGGEVYDASGSCDSSQIVSGGGDSAIILWDVATGQPLRRLRGHAARVSVTRFNEESSMVLSGSQDGTARCWDVRSRTTREAEMVLTEAKDAISSLFVTDHEIVTGSFDGKVRRYDIRAGELTSDCTGHAITCVSATRDGQCVLVSGSDSTVRLLDKDSGELLGEYKGHSVSGFSTESCVDSRDRNVLSGSADGNVWCWDLIQERATETFCHSEDGRDVVIPSLSPHPLSKPELLTAAGGTIRIWGLQLVDDDDEETCE